MKALQTGSAANAAETVKRIKNRSVTDRYKFEAVKMETAANYSEWTKNIVCDNGCRLIKATGHQRETFCLMQKISLEVERCSAASNVILEVKNVSK